MRNMKKFLALALAATMTVTMVPATAFAMSDVVAAQTVTVDGAEVTIKDAVDKTAAAITGFSSGDVYDATTKKVTADFLNKIADAANKNGVSIDVTDVLQTGNVGLNSKTGKTIFPTFKVIGKVTNSITNAKVTDADRVVEFTVTADKLTTAEKNALVEMIAKRAINNAVFTNKTSTKDVMDVVNAGLAANAETKGVTVAGVPYCTVNKSGATSGTDGYVDAKIDFNLKSVEKTQKTNSDGSLAVDENGKEIWEYKTVDSPFSIVTVHGQVAGKDAPLADTATAVVDYTGKDYGVTRTKSQMKNATDLAYARIPYTGHLVNGAEDPEISAYLATKVYYNDGFNDMGTIEKQIEADLMTAGSPLYLQNRAASVKVDYTLTEADHDNDGTVRVLVTVEEGAGNNKMTVPVNVTVKHAPAEVKAEIADGVDTPVSATAIQAENSTTVASEDDAKAAIEKAISERLAGAPDGYTKPYSADLDSSVPFDVHVVDFEASTFYSNGYVTYYVTYSLPKKAGFDTGWNGKTYTVSLPKLKKVSSTAFSIADIKIRKGATKLVEPAFSAGTTNKIFFITPAKNATRQVADLAYKTAGSISGNSVPQEYQMGNTTVTVSKNTASAGKWADTWKVVGKNEGTTVFDAYYINAETGKTYSTSFTVTVTKGFTDVADENAYYYSAVYQLNEAGLLAGVSDTEYAPYKAVTRAQFVSFLYRLAEKRYHQQHNDADFGSYTGETKFTDVSKNAYYAKAVQWASETGVTSGKSATKFDPNGTVTRAEAVTFLYNYMGKQSVYNAKKTFGDVPAGKFYTEAVNWAYANEVTAGKTETMFAPSDPVTRAQAAVFIWNTYVTDSYDKAGHRDLFDDTLWTYIHF